MDLKLVLIVFLFVSRVHGLIQNWDVAVVFDDKIELLDSNGSLIEQFHNGKFTKLRALTFDNLRQLFLASNLYEEKDTLFSFRIDNKTAVEPVIKDLPEYIQGLSVDPISDSLYWTDSSSEFIYFINLNETDREPEIFVNSSKDIKITGLAIDICNRYIYWTNWNKNNDSSIEVALLSDPHDHRTTLISHDIDYPFGIVFDHTAVRSSIYWADQRQGIYYRIESAYHDGSGRRIVHEGAHAEPFALAVDDRYVYWTDGPNFALYRILKEGVRNPAEILREYNSIPYGVIALGGVGVAREEECERVLIKGKEIDEGRFEIKGKEETNEINGENKKEGTGRNKADEELDVHGKEDSQNIVVIEGRFNNKIENDNTTFLERNVEKLIKPKEILVSNKENITKLCLNGHLNQDICVCSRGFSGEYCEIDACHNYCLNDGECRKEGDGKEFKGPTCICLHGFEGNRCERDVCSVNYCLNDGVCKHKNDRPVCQCKDGFSGVRCESSMEIVKMCSVFCERRTDEEDILKIINDYTCRCDDFGAYTITKSNNTSIEEPSRFSYINYMKDIPFLIVSSISFLLLISVVILIVWTCSMRHRRPRIKKRIIVNKNITPLTYRPNAIEEQHQHQCEITIENCCNMNVCETPCFEPPQLRSQKISKKITTIEEDKKKLLDNFENMY